MINIYPDFSEITLGMRSILHPLFKSRTEGLSEFTFANIYLFRKTYSFRISQVKENIYVLTGIKRSESFFMLPFGLPIEEVLMDLFKRYSYMKAVTENQVRTLSLLGYSVTEDRDNFDYIYLKKELATLSGRKYHKKKNLVNLFLKSYTYEGKPLIHENKKDAFHVLEMWSEERIDPGDYEASKEGIEEFEELELCGGIYYVNGEPAAYTLGEEITKGSTYVIIFEKAISKYRGLYQFINMSFASILPFKYVYINREQDLGDEGLRKAKMSYKPWGFVKKYRAVSHD